MLKVECAPCHAIIRLHVWPVMSSGSAKCSHAHAKPIDTGWFLQVLNKSGATLSLCLRLDSELKYFWSYEWRNFRLGQLMHSLRILCAAPHERVKESTALRTCYPMFAFGLRLQYDFFARLYKFLACILHWLFDEKVCQVLHSSFLERACMKL